MFIGGVEKASFVDYPKKVSAVVFTLGCNFRCPFCHNPELVKKIRKAIDEKKVFNFLKSRKGLLDAVCITGGEPTIQKDLEDFIIKIKKLGFLVKLDTNGSNPNILKKLFKKNLLDYVAMDIKAGKEKYDIATGGKADLNKISESISLILKSGIDYQFRTTAVPILIDEQGIKNIANWMKDAKKLTLQQYKTEKTLNKEWQKIKPYSDEKLKALDKILRRGI